MPVTNTTSIASEILSEIQGNRLPPLWKKRVVGSMVNVFNLDGMGGAKRRIPVGRAVDEAYPDIEGMAAPSAALANATAIELTPVIYRQKLAVTALAAARRFPGLAYQQVVNLLSSGDPSTIPLVADVIEASLDSHLRVAERNVYTSFVSADRSAASSASTPTAAPMSIATLLDAQTQYQRGVTTDPSEGTPEGEDGVVAVLTSQGIADIREEVRATETSLWSNPSTDLGIFNLAPDTARSGFRGGIAGVPLFQGEDSMMSTANSAADAVGALFRQGRGGTGESGSVRGAIELCLAFEPVIEYSYDPDAGVAYVHSRYGHVAGISTQAHIVKIIYDID